MTLLLIHFRSTRHREHVLIVYGLGEISSIDEKKLIPDRELSIRKGGKNLSESTGTSGFSGRSKLLPKKRFYTDTPIKDIPEDALNKILYGSDEVLKLSNHLLG